MTRLVLPLAEAREAAVAGGKGASLGELIRAGATVPPGFVVTAGAFAAVLGALDPAGSLAGGESPASLRARMMAVPLPETAAAAITRAYAALGPDADVAVRSSATMENSATASFAGLQDTYLGVAGVAGVLDGVRRCWASLYNEEAVAYRRRIGLPERGLAMAVVVQRMVRPRAAGVMFTRSPVTGDRSVVAIEGTWGLGSALVAGDVTPDSFVISKITGEITARQVRAKSRLHSFIPNGPGVSATDTPADLRGRPCLSDFEIRALASAAARVEAHYGVPQPPPTSGSASSRLAAARSATAPRCRTPRNWSPTCGPAGTRSTWTTGCWPPSPGTSTGSPPRRTCPPDAPGSSTRRSCGTRWRAG